MLVPSTKNFSLSLLLLSVFSLIAGPIPSDQFTGITTASVSLNQSSSELVVTGHLRGINPDGYQLMLSAEISFNDHSDKVRIQINNRSPFNQYKVTVDNGSGGEEESHTRSTLSPPTDHDKYIVLTLKHAAYSVEIYDVTNSGRALEASFDGISYPFISRGTNWKSIAFSSALETAWFSISPTSNAIYAPGATNNTISSPPTGISWTDDGDGTYSGINSRYALYEFTSETSYSASSTVASLVGPLSRSFNYSKWAYDTTAGHPATSSEPGGWTYFITQGLVQYGFYYDPTTKIWQPIGWPEAPGAANHKESVPWIYDPVLMQWIQESQKENWTYDATTKKWTGAHHTFVTNDWLYNTWSYNYETNEWLNETTGETWTNRNECAWHFNDSDTDYFSVSLTNGLSMRHPLDAVWYSPWRGGRMYGSPNGRVYQNGNITEYYNWLMPTTSRPFGTMDAWSNELPEWRSRAGETGWYEAPGSGVKRFPRDFPPLVVVQHQEIIAAYDTAETQEILSLTPAPTATWTNNGRSNEFGLEIPYDTDEGTAPLKVTTTSPDTQLLSDLTYNPAFTSLGDWQFIDSTNGHNWTFEDETGIWTNNATGYQIQYSNPRALCWHDATSNTSWEYDENTKTWSQVVEQSAS